MVKLFDPFTIKDVTLKNRIVMSPMCMYSSENEDGMVNDWHYTHYGCRAVGQVGLIIVEATAVTPQGRISPQDLGIWSDNHIKNLKKLTTIVKSNGAAIGIQLAHAGRKAVLDGEIVAPSAIPFNHRMKTPTEMTMDKIKEVITSFREAARRAKEAEFDMIEIHAAHGYLINEFLSPLTNKRTDQYGGSLENRYRFLKEIIEEIKKEWDGPLFVRISAHEYDENGLKPENHVVIARWMKEQGVDFIDVSSGGVVEASINPYPGYQVPYAELIKKEIGIPTGAVGLITKPVQAEEILQNGRADLIFLGRELLRNPYWPHTAAKELGFSLQAPTPYRRGW